MVGWHNAVATRLGVALAKTEGCEPEDGKAMLHIEAWAFPSPRFVLRRDKMPPLLTSGFPYLYIPYPRAEALAILCRLAMRRGSQIPLAMLARQISIYRLIMPMRSVYS